MSYTVSDTDERMGIMGKSKLECHIDVINDMTEVFCTTIKRVNDSFVDEGEGADDWDERIKSLEEKIGGLQVDLENAKLQQSLASTPEAERWEWCEVDDADYLFDGVRKLVKLWDASRRDMQLMAAAPQIRDNLAEIVRMSSVCTAEGEAHTLPILRETLWEAYQLLQNLGANTE